MAGREWLVLPIVDGISTTESGQILLADRDGNSPTPV